ncbi:MAG: hypothetical protein NXH97_18290 [Rhodobacteraceae bacterium]|nr:hypothetical protein [Paracoccaceae bacterium]
MSFTEVDELIRGDHSALNADDNCIFLREYKANAGYEGETNSLIWNLKKKPSERYVKQGYEYKARSIRRASGELRAALSADWLDVGTLVPIPGSKAVGHPDYDDRMVQVCNGIRPNLDVRSLVVQTKSTEASHTAGDGQRLSVEQLIEVYQLDESLADPPPKSIGIFDDVLTVGRHYRAMHTILSRRFPGVPIAGIFIARTIHPNPFDSADFPSL